jgi:predicted XRE-type DNA-binding protein
MADHLEFHNTEVLEKSLDGGFTIEYLRINSANNIKFRQQYLAQIRSAIDKSDLLQETVTKCLHKVRTGQMNTTDAQQILDRCRDQMYNINIILSGLLEWSRVKSQ